MASCLFKAVPRTVKDFYGLLVSFEPLMVEVSSVWKAETDSGGSPPTLARAQGDSLPNCSVQEAHH